MKRCPKCNAEYTDETLNFCLDDGEWLVSSDTTQEPTTELMSGISASGKDESETRKYSGPDLVSRDVKPRRTWTYIASAGLLIMIAAGGFGIYKYVSFGKEFATVRETKFVRLTSGGKVGDEPIFGGAMISQDGKHVVFWTHSAGKSSCWIKQVLSNSQVKIVGPLNGDYDDSTFSHDGETVYFLGTDKNNLKGALYSIPTIGGTPPRRILEDIASPISFSPDEKQFAFVRQDLTRGETSLMIANTDGSGTPHALATRKQPDDFSVNGPSWSPDGKVIACGVGSQKGDLLNATIFVFPVDGSAAREVTQNRWNKIERVVWLADGSGLVADGDASAMSFGTQIWYISYPDGKVRRITQDLNGYGQASLGVTKDGSTMVAVQVDNSYPIFTFRPGDDPSRAKQISSGKYDGDWTLLAAPNRKVLYTVPSGDANDIWIMNDDGSEKAQLTSDTFLKNLNDISRDGRYVTFTSNRSGHINIWRMDIDGTNLKQLTEGDGIDDCAVFSADGKWVIFDSLRSGKKSLWRVSADGGTAEQLTNRTCGQPAVSPDGKLIACLYSDETGSLDHIGILPIDGGDFVKTLDIPGPFNDTTGIEWTPDGQALAYIGEAGSGANIVSQPIAGGPAKPLTNFTSEEMSSFAWTPDGKQIVYSRGPFSVDVVLIKDFH
jgi:Tol biopolymer transport system component